MARLVTIDARMLSSGIGTYVRNLLSFFKDCGEGLSIRAITSAKDADWARTRCHEVRVVDAPIYTLREQFEILKAAHGADLLHVPHYNAPLPYRGKLLVTIHDLIHITDSTFKRTVASLVYARPMLNLVARKADHIVTDSHYTRTRVVEVLRVSPAKITAIHLGVSSDFCRRDHQEAVAQVSAATGIEWPYILFVGNLKPHKNLETLIRAFALLWARKKIDHQLLVLGDDTKRKGELLSECEKLGVAGVVRFIPQVSYDVLPWVYAAAELLVMPSLIEGFGLPVLEAMACGSPVVCSRAASLPEVAGEAAEFFDPLSVEDLAGAIGRVLESRELQETLRRKGLERAAHFSWDECARRHCEIYRQVLGT